MKDCSRRSAGGKRTRREYPLRVADYSDASGDHPLEATNDLSFKRPILARGICCLVPVLKSRSLASLDDKIKSVTILRERSEEHTSELQSRGHLVCRLLLEKKKKKKIKNNITNKCRIQTI